MAYKINALIIKHFNFHNILQRHFVSPGDPHHSLSLSLSLLFKFLFFYFYRQMLICLKYQLRIRIRTSLSLLCFPFLNNPGRPYNSCPLFMLLSSIYYFLSLILFFYQLPTHSLLLVKNHKIISITQ